MAKHVTSPLWGLDSIWTMNPESPVHGLNERLPYWFQQRHRVQRLLQSRLPRHRQPLAHERVRIRQLRVVLTRHDVENRMRRGIPAQEVARVWKGRKFVGQFRVHFSCVDVFALCLVFALARCGEGGDDRAPHAVLWFDFGSRLRVLTPIEDRHPSLRRAQRQGSCVIAQQRIPWLL